ncbi:MAG: ATP-binding cassette domain-containing protein [Pseudohongiella sp.]|nr:ATP-binding cassette domain-containing protein [Pseudohongiella sp.]
MLTLRDVHIHQGQFDLAIDHWQSLPGELHALLGCNGAGKSTLLRCLGGELSHHGSICLHGRELSLWPSSQRARHLGVLPQSSRLDFAFSAAEVVALGATPLRLSWRHLPSAIRTMMELTDCANLAEQAFPSLSGGEKQRVQLARVLLQLSQAEQAPFLLLDEPTSAQDLHQQHHLLSLVRDLCIRRAYGVVAILHDLNHALRYAHTCSVLHQGQLSCQGQPDNILTPDTVAQHWRYHACSLAYGDGLRVLV